LGLPFRFCRAGLPRSTPSAPGPTEPAFSVEEAGTEGRAPGVAPRL